MGERDSGRGTGKQGGVGIGIRKTRRGGVDSLVLLHYQARLEYPSTSLSKSFLIIIVRRDEVMNKMSKQEKRETGRDEIKLK